MTDNKKKSKRKSISKKLRFEVFKRDNFTCQYCGRSAPDVILEIDHINAIKNGGDNNILNLITSCFDCNRGKGKRKLDENEEVKLQMQQLKEINKKREQLEMLLKWKKELDNFENEQVEKIEELFCDATENCFSDCGKRTCKKLIKQFGFEEVYESSKISIQQYYDENDKENSAEKVFKYIGKICYVRKNQKNSPLEYKINYLCKIAKNNFIYCDSNRIKRFLERNFKEQDFDDLKDIFINSKNLNQLKDNLEYFYTEDL